LAERLLSWQSAFSVSVKIHTNLTKIKPHENTTCICSAQVGLKPIIDYQSIVLALTLLPTQVTGAQSLFTQGKAVTCWCRKGEGWDRDWERRRASGLPAAGPLSWQAWVSHLSPDSREYSFFPTSISEEKLL